MRINNLIARFLVNKATKEEWETLETWKQESQDNLNELMEMQSIWKDSVDLKGYREYDKSMAWERINDLIDDDTPASLETPLKIVEGKKAKYKSIKWLAGIAAAIAILIVSVFNMENNPTEGFHRIASEGIIENFTLPDGSDIFINKNSGLDYAINFESNRNIILDGEAFFDVARNESSPFTIITDEAEVVVLGTSFNINERKGAVDVFVTSGRVKVKVGDQEEILTKNQMVTCENGTITKVNFPGNNYLSWKTRKLVFEESPLHKVVQDLSKHYGEKLVFSGESKAMNQQITDSFENEDFESVLETLVLITGIKYIKEGNTYVIQ